MECCECNMFPNKHVHERYVQSSKLDRLKICTVTRMHSSRMCTAHFGGSHWMSVLWYTVPSSGTIPSWDHTPSVTIPPDHTLMGPYPKPESYPQDHIPNLWDHTSQRNMGPDRKWHHTLPPDRMIDTCKKLPPRNFVSGHSHSYNHITPNHM